LLNRLLRSSIIVLEQPTQTLMTTETITISLAQPLQVAAERLAALSDRPLESMNM
jgi:hypothetical protein